MTKLEFDRMSVEAGFGPCADYMWPEIERMYSTSDRISKELAVDIYWHEPGIYREILSLRYSITDLLARLAANCDGYRFADIGEGIDKLTSLRNELAVAINKAAIKMNGRAKK